MAFRSEAGDPVGIVNASGQPEIVLEINGLTLSMTPPGTTASAPTASDESDAGESETEA